MQQQQHLLLQCLQFTLSTRMNDYGTLFCEQVLELKVLVSIRIVEFNIQNSIKFHCNSIPQWGQQFIETYWTHHPQIASRATQSVIIWTNKKCSSILNWNKNRTHIGYRKGETRFERRRNFCIRVQKSSWSIVQCPTCTSNWYSQLHAKAHCSILQMSILT